MWYSVLKWRLNIGTSAAAEACCSLVSTGRRVRGINRRRNGEMMNRIKRSTWVSSICSLDCFRPASQSRETRQPWMSRWPDSCRCAPTAKTPVLRGRLTSRFTTGSVSTTRSSSSPPRSCVCTTSIRTSTGSWTKSTIKSWPRMWPILSRPEPAVPRFTPAATCRRHTPISSCARPTSFLRATMSVWRCRTRAMARKKSRSSICILVSMKDLVIVTIDGARSPSSGRQRPRRTAGRS